MSMSCCIRSPYGCCKPTAGSRARKAAPVKKPALPPMTSEYVKQLVEPSEGLQAKRLDTKKDYMAKLRGWKTHPNYSAAQHFVEDVHVYFRTIFNEISVMAEQLLRKIESGRLGDRASQVIAFKKLETEFDWRMFHLQGHHSGEDAHMFPEIRRVSPSASAYVDTLEKDHQGLYPLEHVVRTADFDTATRCKAIIEFERFLKDHLNREEMLVVPLAMRAESS